MLPHRRIVRLAVFSLLLIGGALSSQTARTSPVLCPGSSVERFQGSLSKPLTLMLHDGSSTTRLRRSNATQARSPPRSLRRREGPRRRPPPSSVSGSFASKAIVQRPSISECRISTPLRRFAFVCPSQNLDVIAELRHASPADTRSRRSSGHQARDLSRCAAITVRNPVRRRRRCHSYAHHRAATFVLLQGAAWSWVDRHNPASAYPTDFALVRRPLRARSRVTC